MKQQPDPGEGPAGRQERVEQLYTDALALPPEERAGFLTDRCADDAALAAELRSLLEHADAGEAFFERLSGIMAMTQFPPPGVVAGRYHLVGHIGTGGMGSVWRAWDDRLERDVALKFLPARIGAQSDDEERLLSEARAAAALEHPNVCAVHEIGTTDEGLPFLAMAFYEGETLRERLLRGPLAPNEAIDIASQVACGLAAAHERGIIHRDVKPGNIMLARGGTVKLLDFGLATTPDANTLRPSATPGTIAYMSPEQARGEPVDPRSDLWSLGVVLYEMLTGTRPFRADDDRALLEAVRFATPEPLGNRAPAASPALGNLIDRLLAQDAGMRFATAEAVVADLRRIHGEAGSSSESPLAVARSRPHRPVRIAAAVALLVGIGGAAIRLDDRANGAALSAGPDRVLVADFANTSADTSLGSLIAYVLRSELARSPVLSVVGDASIADARQRMRLDAGVPLTGAAARELAIREEVKVVVEGGVRAVGTGVVLTASVVAAGGGDIIHGATEIAPDTALLPAIVRLARGIRQALGESVASVQAGDSLWSFTTSSLHALQKHVAGSRALHRGDFATAADLLREAIALDPDFGHAHLILFSALDGGGEPADRTLPHLLRAYELRNRLTARERHAVEGMYNLEVTGDLTAAISAYRKHIDALHAYPRGEAGWYSHYGRSLALRGDLATAERVLLESHDRFRTGTNQQALVAVLYALGKERQARAVLAEALDAFPDHPGLRSEEVGLAVAAGHLDQAHALAARMRGRAGLLRQAEVDAMRGRMGEAIDHLAAARDGARERNPGAALEIAAAIGRLKLLAGDPGGADEVDRLLASHPVESVAALSRPYLQLALFHSAAGRPDRARVWLASYEREYPHDLRGPNRWMLHRARAAIHLAAGAAAAAVEEMDSAARFPPLNGGLFDVPRMPTTDLPERARAYERLGEPDSALAIYERYLARREIDRVAIDALELGSVLERAAALYEERGDRKRAAALDRRLAEVWHQADATLRPRAPNARARSAAPSPPRH